MKAATQDTPLWVPLVTGFGGVVLGYLLNIVRDWIVQSRRERDRFQAAALLVSDELRANIVKLEIARDTGEDPEPLASQAYHAHELILARHLPPDARDAVRGAYIHAQVPRAFQVRNPAGQRVGSTSVLEEALSKTARARELLKPHIPCGAAEI